MVLALRLVLLLAGPVGQGALAEASSAVASWTTPPSAQGEATKPGAAKRAAATAGLPTRAGPGLSEAQIKSPGSDKRTGVQRTMEADQIEGQGSDAPTGAQSAMKADIEPGASANAGAAAWPSTHHGRALSEAVPHQGRERGKVAAQPVRLERREHRQQWGLPLLDLPLHQQGQAHARRYGHDLVVRDERVVRLVRGLKREQARLWLATHFSCSVLKSHAAGSRVSACQPRGKCMPASG